jgi:hypothetical protein
LSFFYFCKKKELNSFQSSLLTHLNIDERNWSFVENFGCSFAKTNSFRYDNLKINSSLHYSCIVNLLGQNGLL